MPLRLKTKPKKRNDSSLFGASIAMNWGTKAKKNRATLGFRALVKKPW